MIKVQYEKCPNERTSDEKLNLYRQLPVLLLPWYWNYARVLQWRADKNPYHVWISEIMLQQTRVDTVKEYYRRFLEAFPTVADLACAEEERVIKLWEGLGYYSRARNLHKTAKIIHTEYADIFPSEIKYLRKLPGIGEYSSGAIASICFEQPTPAVDGNVLRIISRITEDYRSINDIAYKKDVTTRLAEVYPKKNRGDFTQSLMELGATVCLPNGAPLCEYCPTATICSAKRSGNVSALPVKREKTTRKLEHRTFFILFHNGKTAVRKRTEKGVLCGMWEFPNVEGILSPDEAHHMVNEFNKGNTIQIDLKHGKHIFTHIEWNIRCYCFHCTDLTPSSMPSTSQSQSISPSFEWVDFTALNDVIALPTAFKKFWNPDIATAIKK